MSFEPLGYGDRWYDRVVGRHINLQGWQISAFIAVFFLFVGIAVWDSDSIEREARAAVKLRLHDEPKLSFDEQRLRGVICGDYQLPSQSSLRFVFVSHYSSGDNPEGLLISTDLAYAVVASRVCDRR